MHFVATQFEKKILQEVQVCLDRTQEHNIRLLIVQYTIFRGALKDFRMLPKSNKTSSYIKDHSGDILTRYPSVP